MRFDQGLVIETQTQMRAAHAAVLREADPAVGGELTWFYRGTIWMALMGARG